MFHGELLPDQVFLGRDLLAQDPGWVRPYKIDSNETEGRYFVAARDVAAGELILREKSVFCGPQLSTKPICLACYRWVDGSYRCSKCGWPLCSKKCEKNPGQHATECAIFQSKKFKMDTSGFKFGEAEQMYDVIPALRALSIRDKQPENWKLFWNLMSHLDNWMKDPEWKVSHQYIIDFILDKLEIENVSDKMILTIFGIFYTNDFSVRIHNKQLAPENQVECSKIRLCYPLISMASHDCVPNCIYDHINVNGEDQPPDFEVVLRSKRPIKKGEKIYISYVDILLPTYIRQKNLLEGKKFLCQCQRCVDPTSLGTYADALLCTKCKYDLKTNKGFIIRNQDNRWKCNQCKYEKNVDDVERLLDGIHQETDELLNNPKNNTIDLFEAFLKKYEKILHPNHMFFILVKYNLSGHYGRLPGYQMHEMSPEVVKRKIQICRQTYDVIEKFDLGLGCRKGMLMYELHMPLIMITQMQLQAGQLGKDQAKKDFRQAVKYLQDSLDILKHEQEDTFEKNVYYGAKDSVEPIKNFINSL